MRQSKNKKSDAPTKAVEITAPISSGIQWLEAVSIIAESAIIVCVRSERSFFEKNESGSLRSFSASVVRRIPLSV